MRSPRSVFIPGECEIHRAPLNLSFLDNTVDCVLRNLRRRINIGFCVHRF